MSYTTDVLETCMKSIGKRLPKGDPAKMAELAEDYACLTDDVLASRAASIKLTHTVVDSTAGRASNAFEHFSHVHTGAMQRLADAAEIAQRKVQAYGNELKQATDSMKALFVEVVKLWHIAKSDACSHQESVELIKQGHQKVRLAIELATKLEDRAGDLGRSIARHADDLELPAQRAHGHAFIGGYENSDATEMHRGYVWVSGGRFISNAAELKTKVAAFDQAVHRVSAASFGADEYGRAFAAGHKPAAKQFVSGGKRAAEQVEYIGHALQNMVHRHNEDEADAQIAMAQTLQNPHFDDRLRPANTDFLRPLTNDQPTDRGTGGGGHGPNDRDRYVPDERHGPTEPATSGSKPYVANPDVGHKPSIKNPDPRPVLGDPLGRAFGKLWETPSPAAP